MTPWLCAIDGCGAAFETPERLVEHQAQAHDPCDCAVCGESLPAGFPAIHHAFTEHTRAAYLRAYEADSDDIRARERVIEAVEDETDVSALLESVGVETVTAAAGD